MTTKGKLAWGFVLLVTALHMDFCWWDSTAVVLGFVPLTLAYQVGITIAAALAWALVMRHAWPREVEEWASAPAARRALPERPDGRGGDR
jgi:hypothetical protein